MNTIKTNIGMANQMIRQAQMAVQLGYKVQFVCLETSKGKTCFYRRVTNRRAR